LAFMSSRRCKTNARNLGLAARAGNPRRNNRSTRSLLFGPARGPWRP
jgi:hypothetical protein